MCEEFLMIVLKLAALPISVNTFDFKYCIYNALPILQFRPPLPLIEYFLK